MNEKKLNQLFAAARNDVAPEMPGSFAAKVMRSLRVQPRAVSAELNSVWDHLNSLFPRIAFTAAAVIILCVATDWGLTAIGLPDVTDGSAQVASQYLFTPDNL